jgi:hypothetical protein
VADARIKPIKRLTGRNAERHVCICPPRNRPEQGLRRAVRLAINSCKGSRPFYLEPE